MNKTRLIKWIDALFGPLMVLAVTLVKSPRAQKNPCFEKVLILRPGGIGDAVLLIPVINELKARFPQTTIDVLAEKRNCQVFSLSQSVNTILHYDNSKELLTTLRNGYDIVIDTEQWHRLSAVVARLTRAPMLIGFATNNRKNLFTHPIPYSQRDYEVDSFIKLLAPILDSSIEPEVPFLTIPDDVTGKAKTLLAPLLRRRIVAIFPGSSINERKWGSERFHQTAKLLSAQRYGIVVVGGKEDTRAGEEIIRELPNAINLSKKLSLPETAAVIQQSSLLISGDSGIMHLGYGLGVKIVALFGPGREKKWAPRGRNCIVINKHLPCSPCTTFGYTPRCKINALCMSSISVEEVYKAALVLLKDSDSSLCLNENTPTHGYS